MTRRTLCWCTPLLIVTAACSGAGAGGCSFGTSTSGGDSTSPPAFGLTLAPLALPAPEGSAYPQLTSSPRGAILSWLEQEDATTTLAFSERTSAGWSANRQVAKGDDWFVTSADIPSVLRLTNGTLVANWYPTTDALIEAYETRLSYSSDEGKTWSKPISPHHDGTKTQHGFVSLFELAGGVGLVWLDGRDQEQNTTDPLGGSMALYFASFDTQWKQTAETRVDARVCECCQTAAVATTDGVLTAFRDRSPEEVRDIKVSRLDNGAWTSAQSVHDDNWKIDACPVNGPALSARGRDVAVAWFTAEGDKGRAFAAFSQDAGRTWSAPIRLDNGVSSGHVDIEWLDDGSAAASWVEFADQRSRLRVRRVWPSGARSDAVEPPGSVRVSGYPRMTRAGDELILAWTDSESGQQLKGAVARLPRAGAP
ncbi:MAG TPA: sialidase family protein [Vicinamibacterales bacterium]|nr:sialidase family protein [Vicinamibacterales bacterium]